MMNWEDDMGFYSDYPLLKARAYRLMGTLINDAPKSILDYGCGDGKQIKFLNKYHKINLYDINKNAVKRALQNNADWQLNEYELEDEIPPNEFDVIICSLVLMCISNKRLFSRIIENFKNYLKPDSVLLILITHPAFREQEFSYYRTDFKRPFDYFDEGMPFKVHLKNSNENIHFTDFHWSLSFTLNTILKSGFILEEMTEIKDVVSNQGYYNERFSPYLLLKFKS